MKVCCIGDVHGTDKFLKCYDNILKNDNDCERIIVFGDHFDPYESISLEEMISKYNKFIDVTHEDERVISLLGNHDLSHYVLQGDKTNRTNVWNAKKIKEAIVPNLKDSYLCYKIEDYLFSHAGISERWFSYLTPETQEKLLNNQKGWTDRELRITCFEENDWSCCGDDIRQGCTWIRPMSLVTNPYGDYNQVVAHTRVDKFEKILMDNGKDLWLIDTKGNPDYLVLNI